MTVYTSASRTHKPQYGVCKDGSERTKAALARLGLTMKSVVPMKLVLDELGLVDCLFSFCEVVKGCEPEAGRVLRQYMQYVLELTNEYLGVLYESHALTKRLNGIDRPLALEQEYGRFNTRFNDEPDVVRRRGLDVYRILTCAKPDYQIAIHATQALLYGAELIEKREEVFNRLYERLGKLLA